MKNEYVRKRLSIYFNGNPRGLLQDFKDTLLNPEVASLFEINYQTSQESLYIDFRGKTITDKDKELQLYDTVMKNNVLIYDLNSCNLSDLRLALRLLKNSKLSGGKKLILVSNILTWEDTVHRPPKINDREASILSDYDNILEEKQDEENNEIAEEEIIESEDEQAGNDTAEEEAESEPVPEITAFNEQQYLERRGKGIYNKFIEIENLAINLAKSVPELTVHVLCPGIVYGMMMSPLYEVLKQAWLQQPTELEYITTLEPQAKPGKVINAEEDQDNASDPDQDNAAQKEKADNKSEPVPLEELPLAEYNKQIKYKRLFKGKNILPLIHINDLLQYLKFMVLENYKLPNYILARDQAKTSSQIDIIRCISKGIGSGKSISVDKVNSCYSDELKRIFVFDINFKATTVFQQHLQKLKALKEEAEQNEAAQEPEKDEDDEEATKIEPQVAVPAPITYPLAFKRGIGRNIATIKDEFCKQSGLRSNKILVVGTHFSGRTTLSKLLARYFKVPYLNINNIVDEIITRTDELANEVKTYIEERREDYKTLYQESTEKRKKQKKYNVQGQEAPRPLLSKELAIKCLKTRLRDNICVNRGYILDDIFDDYKSLSQIYKCKIIR